MQWRELARAAAAAAVRIPSADKARVTEEKELLQQVGAEIPAGSHEYMNTYIYEGKIQNIQNTKYGNLICNIF